MASSNMNKYWIKIQNDGEIDINGLHLMGISTKREEDKIGFFGSGNKYAIALLLREKIPFKIFSGKKKIEVTSQPVMFRGQLFDQILINGEKTSLTTAMGPDWETWFAVREIYCNAQDEGGAKIEVCQKITPSKGKTTVFIALTKKLSAFFHDINRYILVSQSPKMTINTEYGKVDIYNGGDEFICYRKGIRIYPENSRKCLYNYNFSNIDINESRVYKYEHQIKERIASALTNCEDREIILNYLRNWKGNFEEYLHWEKEGGYVTDSFSQEWHKVLDRKRVYPESVATISGDFEGKANSFIVPDNLATKIHDEIKTCEVVGKKSEKSFEVAEPTDDQKNKIDQSLKELKNIGYNITSKIVVAKTYMDDVVAWYEKDNDTIYLSQKFLTTIPYIKNTILEEHFHSLGHVDGNREFVTFLIDEIIRIKENDQP